MIEIQFSGPHHRAFAALKAAEAARCNAAVIPPDRRSDVDPYADCWIEVTDVRTSPDEPPDEWAQRTLDGMQSLMAGFGFIVRSTSSGPIGRATRIPERATLRDAATGELLREATPDEWLQARTSPPPEIIMVDGRECIVVDDDHPAA